MVDPERTARLLRGIEERLDRLEDERDADGSIRCERRWLDGVKHLFVTAIEGAVDVARHRRLGTLGGSGDECRRLRVLGRNGVLDDELTSAMAEAAGFRNVLVHRYAVVDDDRVIDFLDELDTLRRYVEVVSGWILANEH